MEPEEFETEKLKTEKLKIEKLVIEAKNRNPDAFDRLMQTQMQRMYRIAIAMLQNEEDAADAIQETVLRCWEKIGQLKSTAYFQTWLTRILINQCKDILRSRKRFVLTEDMQELSGMPHMTQEDAYSNVEWKQIMSSLDEKYRIVLELYYMEGFSTKEIADMLHITDMNVRSRMVRARKQLGQVLQADVGEYQGGYL